MLFYFKVFHPVLSCILNIFYFSIQMRMCIFNPLVCHISSIYSCVGFELFVFGTYIVVD